MRELLEDIPAEIQNNAVFELGRKIEDFRLKVTVFKAYPVSAKLGTKEDLYIDQRFYVYEIEQEKNGNQKINRKGVVRVKTINDNKQVATGSSLPSVFQQVAGGGFTRECSWKARMTMELFSISVKTVRPTMPWMDLISAPTSASPVS